MKPIQYIKSLIDKGLSYNQIVLTVSRGTYLTKKQVRKKLNKILEKNNIILH